MKFVFIPYTGKIFVLDKKTLCHRSFFYIKNQSHSENKVATVVAVLGYEAMLYCRKETTFQDILSIPSSGLIKTRIIPDY
jgi:hypothetical protein